MIKIFNNKRAWMESISDTSIALLINFPLNILLLYMCRLFDLSVLMTSVILSIVFTVVALLRKYFVRVFFSDR